MVMKRIVIFILILSSIGCDIFAGQTPAQRRREARLAAAGKAVTPVQVVTPVATKPVAVAKQTIVQRPVAATGAMTPAERRRMTRLAQGGSTTGTATRGVIIAKPITIEAVIWDELTDEQQESFTKLNPGFEKSIAKMSTPKTYKIWFESVMKWAKNIINISPLLTDYCIESIEANLDATEETRKIDAEEQKLLIDEQ